MGIPRSAAWGIGEMMRSVVFLALFAGLALGQSEPNFFVVDFVPEGADEAPREASAGAIACENAAMECQMSCGGALSTFNCDASIDGSQLQSTCKCGGSQDMFLKTMMSRRFGPPMPMGPGPQGPPMPMRDPIAELLAPLFELTNQVMPLPVAMPGIVVTGEPLPMRDLGAEVPPMRRPIPDVNMVDPEQDEETQRELEMIKALEAEMALASEDEREERHAHREHHRMAHQHAHQKKTLMCYIFHIFALASLIGLVFAIFQLSYRYCCGREEGDASDDDSEVDVVYTPLINGEMYAADVHEPQQPKVNPTAQDNALWSGLSKLAAKNPGTVTVVQYS